jgi:exodeoxyribonuclease V beta subunit
VANYTDEAMKRAMFDHNYPLQALIYCVALHRFLRWRLPGYDPAIHLGGVGYLFLRGMNGDLQPNGEPYGVFRWNPPAALIVAASDAFSGGEPR